MKKDAANFANQSSQLCLFLFIFVQITLQLNFILKMLCFGFEPRAAGW